MTKKLNILQLFIYGLPGLPLAMLGLPLFVYLPNYYSQNIGLSLSAVGFALLLARTVDVITDPLIGVLNDKYPSSKSIIWRRKAFMVIGLPLLIVGLNYLLKPDDSAGVLYLFVWSFITYLGWTLINIPWLAMGAEISHEYHEKSALASSREIFSVIGTVLVISLPVMLSLQFDLKQTLDTVANLLTLLLPLALIPLFLKTRYQNESKPSTTTNVHLNRAPNKQSKVSFTKKLFALIKHPAIKKLLPAYFINSIANALPATLFIIFVTYVLKIPDQVGILLISYFVSAVVGIPVWLFIAAKTDKHVSWCLALLGSVICFLYVPFLSERDFTAFLLVCLGTGFCLGADVVMPASIQSDLAQIISNSNSENIQSSPDDSNQQIAKQDTAQKTEYRVDQTVKADHTQQNSSSTALLFGIWGLLTKLSLALAIGISFPLLDFLGLDTSQLESEATINKASIVALIILYAIVPIIFKMWVFVSMWNFTYGKEYISAFWIALENKKINKGNKINEYEINKDSDIHRAVSFSSSYKRV